MLTALQQLFGTTTGAGGAGGAANLSSQLPLATNGSTNGATLAGLRFSIDTRTNTILVSGPESDLQVIEDLLIRLDEQGNNGRDLQVWRLSNAPAEDVATALNSYITTNDTVNSTDPTAVNPLEQTRRQIIIVPEPVTNSLIISATPEYFAVLYPIIQSLDRRPLMVKIKVLIAQVTLNAVDEFGIEMGLQDSLLFDRGLSTIRFPFNQSALGNDNTTASLASREDFAGQALSNLGIGRTNADTGYGGLVLSAGNESINVLLRALKDRSAVRILADPYVTTVDNLLARIVAGQQISLPIGAILTGTGATQTQTVQQDVGIILEITPRVSPDGLIVMAVNVTNSSLSPEQGTAIGTDANGNVIRSPIINQTTAETTIMSRSGQTVAFSGLIQDTKSDARRGIPILSDMPLIGPFFRFDSEKASRSELLIVLTPYLVNSDDAIDTGNTVEYERMHWCLGDVLSIHGTLGYDPSGSGSQFVPTGMTPIYYPDQDPTGEHPQLVPPDPTGTFDNEFQQMPDRGAPANPPNPVIAPAPTNTSKIDRPAFLNQSSTTPRSPSSMSSPAQASNVSRGFESPGRLANAAWDESSSPALKPR